MAYNKEPTPPLTAGWIPKGETMATTTTRSTQPAPGPAPLPGPNAISEALAQVTARLRLARWVRHAARGALAGVAVALVAVVCAHFDVLPDWLPLEAVLPLALLLGIAGGTITTFLKPISLMDAARLAEARLGLKERLSSALEFERAPQAAVAPDAVLLMRLQQEDAAAHARGLKAVEAVPLRWPWEAKAVGGGLAVLALALFLPTLPIFLPPGVLTERQIVHKTGDKLQKTARLIQKQAEGQHLEGTRRAAINMQRLGKRLASGKLDKKQAMVQISKLTQQMKLDQQKMAQANSGTGAGSKSLAQAGAQMAQALSGASASGSGSKTAGGGQKSGGGNKAGQKPGGGGNNGSKAGAGDPFHGFNVPGANKNKNANPASSPSSGPPPTPELRKAAQAMQQNDSQGLSEQLRQMASRTESGKMSSAEQGRAAQDLQTLSDALKNTPMPETQKHTQAAADAMKRGDKQAAAAEMRKAADAAEREAHEQADQEAMQNAQDATEGSESEMAGANSAGDIQDDSGQPGQGQGKGKGKGNGQGQGEGDGEGEGDGQGLPGSHGQHGSGKGNGGSGGGGMAGGKPGDTGEGSSPLKHLGKMDPSKMSKNNKLYCGKPESAGPSKTGPMRKVGSNPNATPGQTLSKVPYYDYVAPAQKRAESTMDKEDIPPAYRSDVRKYFNALNPPAGGGGH